MYSVQKNKEVGNGNITKAVKLEPGWEENVAADKAAQVAENLDYKRKLAANEPVEKKFFKRGDTGSEFPNKLNSKGEPRIIPTSVRPELLASREISVAPIERSNFHLRLTPHTGNTLYVLGSSKRGKSTAIMKIYDDYFGGADRNYVSILWSVNPQISAYKGHSKLIKASWNKQTTMEIVKAQQLIQKKTRNEYKFLNIFDDVLHVRGEETMENLIMTYRNSKISSIIAMQYTNQLQKNCRANVNGILLFGFNSDEAIEVVIKCFLKGHLHSLGIIKVPDMINWYKRATEDHGFIYVIPETAEVSLHKFRL